MKYRILHHFLLFILLFHYSYNDDCIIDSFSDLNYPKVITLKSGYHLMVTRTGIFSFYPGLSSFASQYIFTEDQKLSDNIDIMQNSINQVEISQFLGEEEGNNNYVICYAKTYVYFLNQKGAILFN